ncbi:hypothetical protein AGABI2DRAFT_146509 [Agaricus bisporus var. bisporus H97]|uniref:hypothetical protein n=1 Tax=Agaricus bisporus var. bisporus (strain H97 / ATCC MYA-4626 / FGSC 10389) TaxID=936046 RepID=UPI00029F6EF9|nr:hypothetical protein AGABI2DRAFT_146509 [Agaricus bisporus var. bisporus H97]EKV42447.1 hypothetical protein AGABI2DRAFT_146509 [Agaricus bisporus var. bisporus H97]
MNIDNNFTDYITEDIWHAPDPLSIDGVSTHQDLHFPCPPAFNVDVDILILLARDEIHTVEQQIRGERGQSPWGSNIWDYDPVIGRPESHWEAVGAGFHHNSWETSLTTNPDMCAMDWSCSSLRHEPSPNIPDYTFPMCGLYPPTSHQQPTEPSVNGPPPVCTNNYQQGLQWGTPIGDILPDFGGPLHATETFRTDALRARVTGDIPGYAFTPSRAVGLPFVQPFPEMYLNRETERQSSQKSGTCPVLPSTTRTNPFSAEPSLHGKGTESGVSTPPHLPEISQVDLPPATTKAQRKPSERVLRKRTPPKCQTSPADDVTDCKATLGTSRSNLRNPPCKSEVTCSRKRSSPRTKKRSPSKATDSKQPQKRKRRKPSKSAASSSRVWQIRLARVGFVRTGGAFRCACGKSFRRGWDAGRHWTFAAIHKAQRQNSGDFSDSLRNLCTNCGEVLSREDALERHRPKCGQRKKRQYQNGWNPKALGY